MPIPELMAGWQRFRANRFRDQRALFERITREGQRPKVAMVACCDSRVDPAIVFDCEPGDVFLVRNVANLVPPYERAGSYHGTSAALEFAINVLGVQHVVVLGHSHCGGIRALLDGPPQGEPMHFLTAWMSIAEEARKAAQAPPGLSSAARGRLCEQLAIRLSVRNLRSFPTIGKRVESRELRVHGWHFDLRDGLLSVLDQDSDRFVPIDAEPAT
jgi:carbonic anhydrase